MAEFLFEIVCEEIPASMQSVIASNMQERFLNALKEKQVTYKNSKIFYTPRRLVLVIDGLLETLPKQTLEKKGPRVGADAKALEGFLKVAGVKIENLERRKLENGEFYFAIQTKLETKVIDIIKQIGNEVLPKVYLPKSMLWANYNIKWARPIKNILALFNEKVVEIEFGHLKANNKSNGHLTLSNEDFEVKNFADLERKLSEKNVVLSNEKRKQIILDEAKKIASNLNFNLIENQDLIDEIVGLSEFPNVAFDNIDEKYMSLPKEVLISSIKKHQKYLYMEDVKNKHLAPYFIFVSNIPVNDNIKNGNKKVLRARLEDAKFFYESDKKIKLDSLQENLKSIVFHQKLGSLFDKTQRVSSIIKFLSIWVPFCKADLTERCAQIYKCDLTLEVVKEFPELQGIMGYYYALNQHEEKEVALAIKEHYQPVSLIDEVPTNPLSVALALSDKIDSLVGLYLAGEKPSGSGDPFSLRRMALGIIKIILKNKISINLNLLLIHTLKQLPKEVTKEYKSIYNKKSNDDISADIADFIYDRLKFLLKNEGVQSDIIETVAIKDKNFDIFQASSKIANLALFLKQPSGKKMIENYKRANNIFKNEKGIKSEKVSPKLFQEPIEQELFEFIRKNDDIIDEKIDKNQFKDALELLLILSQKVDLFFDKILINAEDEHIKQNRFALIAFILKQYNKYGNFSVIEG